MSKLYLRIWHFLFLIVLSDGGGPLFCAVHQHTLCDGLYWKYSALNSRISTPLSSPESSRGLDDRRLGDSTSEGSVGKQKPLKVERVEHIGAFDREKLERSFGLVRFRSSAQARYALDLGDESWYLGSVKMDAFYKEFATEYTAPWKLIPLGERDVVEAYYEGSKGIDLSRVRFAPTPDSPALPADFIRGDSRFILMV